MHNNIYSTRLKKVIVGSPDKSLAKAEGIFLVMDYVEGSLKDMIENVNPADLSMEHVRVLFYNILCAINYLHSAGIMHRDLKPTNLLVNENCNLKICDFGQARPVKKVLYDHMSDESMSQSESDTKEINPKLIPQTKKEPRRSLSPFICNRWYRPPEIILS